MITRRLYLQKKNDEDMKKLVCSTFNETTVYNADSFDGFDTLEEALSKYIITFLTPFDNGWPYENYLNMFAKYSNGPISVLLTPGVKNASSVSKSVFDSAAKKDKYLFVDYITDSLSYLHLRFYFYGDGRIIYEYYTYNYTNWGVRNTITIKS